MRSCKNRSEFARTNALQDSVPPNSVRSWYWLANEF